MGKSGLLLPLATCLGGAHCDDRKKDSVNRALLHMCSSREQSTTSMHFKKGKMKWSCAHPEVDSGVHPQGATVPCPVQETSALN